MKAGLVFSLLAAALLHAGPTCASPAADMHLIYWTVGDCGPCLLWSRSERKQELLAEAKRLGITFVEVSRPRLADPVARYAWPAAQQTLAEQMQAYPAAQFTPAFDFVCKGQLQRRLAGLADWDSFWRKTLRTLARECPVG